MYVIPCDGQVEDVCTMPLTIALLLFSSSQGMLIEGPPGPEGPTVSKSIWKSIGNIKKAFESGASHEVFLHTVLCITLLQGLPGPSGPSGLPGSVGDPGERVSVVLVMVFKEANILYCTNINV